GGVAGLVVDAVAEDPAAAVAGGHLGLGDAVDQAVAAAAVLDEHVDGDDRQAELGGDRVEAVAAGAALAVEDLDEDARRGEAGQAGEVDGRLGVAGAAEDAPLLGDQGEEVAGADEVGR